MSDIDDPCSLGYAAQVLEQLVGEGMVLQDEPLSKHTSFEIGGPARVYVMPDTASDVQEVLAFCRQNLLPTLVIGKGSDLLVADEGFEGVVIDLSHGLLNVSIDGTLMHCAAGVPLKEASEMACELGLSGLEFACGIPGSVGGACFMNAGAYDGCIADVLKQVSVLMPDGSVQQLAASELRLGYRQSRIKDEGLIVLSATFMLKPADTALIRAKMDDLTQRREEKQPLELASAGSTFKRPEGYFVGKLVSDAGLKGYRVGNAAVSEKHAGFVVNLGGASCSDVLAVIAHIRQTIYDLHGVELEPEVRLIGCTLPPLNAR